MEAKKTDRFDRMDWGEAYEAAREAIPFVNRIETMREIARIACADAEDALPDAKAELTRLARRLAGAELPDAATRDRIAKEADE